MRFEERVEKTQLVMRKVMERADRSVWRCDPRHHIEGETYITVTRLLQGYIENEVDMNNDNTCRENCNAYQFTESYSCYKELFCARQPKCSGKLLNCQFFDSDMWICPSVSTFTSFTREEFDTRAVNNTKSHWQALEVVKISDHKQFLIIYGAHIKLLLWN